MSPALAGGFLTTGPQEKSFTASLSEWHTLLGFPCGSAGEESACNEGDLGLKLGWEDPLEKGKATQSSVLAWRIPWTVESMGSQRVRHG